MLNITDFQEWITSKSFKNQGIDAAYRYAGSREYPIAFILMTATTFPWNLKNKALYF